MATLDEALSQRHRLSVWHIYHEVDEHISITPFRAPKQIQSHNTNEQGDVVTAGNSSSGNRAYDPNSYLVQCPAMPLNQTPRTLHRGGAKKSDAICIIKCGFFWRHWVIQLGDKMKNAIDYNDLAKRKRHTAPNDSTFNYGSTLERYKSRLWKAWGATGKDYNRRNDTQREAATVHAKSESIEIKDKSIDRDLEMGTMGSNNGSSILSPSEADLQKRDTQPPPCTLSRRSLAQQPTVADGTFLLKWSSPFSLSTRCYCFQYAGVLFSWEGTRDLHPDYKWNRRLMPFSHLKLIAKIPGVSTEELFIAQYSSSLGDEKYGELWVFDSALTKVLEMTGHPLKWMKRTEEGGRFSLDLRWDIRQTQLYDMVIASAMCMIIGERHKRALIWLIFWTWNMVRIVLAMF
ncbi:hypothetical protein NUH16_011091 [Penicillium rubens]|nr:hypothetical protein NUH16_011091 [Penicillium rubens]